MMSSNHWSAQISNNTISPILWVFDFSPLMIVLSECVAKEDDGLGDAVVLAFPVPLSGFSLITSKMAVFGQTSQTFRENMAG